MLEVRALPPELRGLTWADEGFGGAPRWRRAIYVQQRSGKRPPTSRTLAAVLGGPNDIYLAQRQLGRQLKTSFHESGQFQASS